LLLRLWEKGERAMKGEKKGEQGKGGKGEQKEGKGKGERIISHH